MIAAVLDGPVTEVDIENGLGIGLLRGSILYLGGSVTPVYPI
jgi:hypothetical protein